MEAVVKKALADGYTAEEMAAVETHIKEAAASIVPEMFAVDTTFRIAIVDDGRRITAMKI